MGRPGRTASSEEDAAAAVAVTWTWWAARSPARPLPPSATGMAVLERLPPGQAAGDLARRADRHRADHPGTDIGHEPGIAQRHARRAAARQHQQRHEERRHHPREHPPPPRGRVGAARRAR
jgi:hypothetical protein